MMREKRADQIAWNTGRSYAAAGQRIAAQSIDGGVYFVDVDRMVHGFLPGVSLDAGSILRAYDANEHSHFFYPPSFDQNHPDCCYPNDPVPFNCFRAELDELALSVPPLQVEKGY